MIKFFKRIGKHFWVYIVFCLGASILTPYILGLVNQPRKEETITIFVASHASNTDKFRAEVNKNRPDYLREILYKTYSIDDPDFDAYYLSYAFGFSDIVIMPESELGNETIKEYYAVLNNIQPSYFPNNETYKIGDDDYGILIHKKDDPSYSNNDLITYKLADNDENYYMFFDADSLHVGEINGSKYNTAFDLMQVFKI